MRISNQMTQATSLNLLTKNYSTAVKYNTQLSAMRQVLDIQDNPLASITGINAAASITKLEQYTRNINTAISSLSMVDAQLGNAKTILDEIKTLLTTASSETATVAERQAIAFQVKDSLMSLLNIANTTTGQRYLFGGTHTGSSPFTTAFGNYVQYNGNNNLIEILTGLNSLSSISVTGSDAFGNLTTTVSSDKYSVKLNMTTDHSTPLSSLNNGDGVPKGSIVVYYSSHPEGLEIDISSCDTVEDIKDVIEKATLEASRNLSPETCPWLDGSTLDWKDLTDRYVEVTLNADGTGLSLREIDLGEALPEPTWEERNKGIDYSGNPGYHSGGAGIGAGAVCDKADYIYGDGTGFYTPLRVDDAGTNKVATALGIKGTATFYDPNNPDGKVDGYVHGGNLKAIVTGSTLLSDIIGYNDARYTITNGDKPNVLAIRETSNDSGNVFSNWNLSNLSPGYNTGKNGELYAKVYRDGGEVIVELYAAPLDQAKASDLVARGSTSTAEGGTVQLYEANSSGVTGSVGIVLPAATDEATVNLQIEFGNYVQDTIHVPSFKEYTDAFGISLDYLNLLSGWSITGLDKAPASGYDLNHPPSTDLNGDISVNVRMVDNGDGTSSAIVELYRPAYNGLPAALIATGELNLGGHPPLDTAASGRISFVGAEGFEQVSGSVYFELPAGTLFGDGVTGTGANSPTTFAYQLTSALPAYTEFFTAGSLLLAADQTLANNLALKADTLFQQGQVFGADMILPNGEILIAGTPLPYDVTYPRGTDIPAGTTILAGTLIPAGSTVTFADGLAAGTTIPAGSYTTDGVTGFPADGMVSTDPSRNGQAMGFNLNATFATVDDLIRAVEEAGLYVGVQISEDGRRLEFVSTLSGAYLTISEDTDCYEQMNDVYQQLSALDLNGLVRGVTTDRNGNVYTEVVYYPPDPYRSDGKVLLLNDDGEQILIDAGYYVRVYSDSDALDTAYENRDNSSLIAEGFIPAGEWDNTDPDNPYIPIPPSTSVGFASPLVLEERNNSGVSGTVTFDYYGGRNQTTIDSDGNHVYDPYNNSAITVSPGGLRSDSSLHTVLQEIDIGQFIPGVHCDFSGVAHATISYDDASQTTTVCIYRDVSNTHMTAKGEINGATGEVIFYETDKSGNYILDRDGNRIPVGSMVIAGNTLLDGQTDSFTITMGGLGASGQERETNIFATIKDAIDALNANDVEALHYLLDQVTVDIDRLLAARAEVSASMEQLEMISDRYQEDIINYQLVWGSNVGMDENALLKIAIYSQAADNAYEAAMAMASRYFQMGLMSYL